jgi:hypothetical protein
MGKHAPGPWHVKKKGEAVGVIGDDSSVVAVFPRKRNGDDTRVNEAYLLAAAPLMLEACSRIYSILENSIVVTPEGFKMNCSDIRKSLADAIMRAKGYRKTPHEP